MTKQEELFLESIKNKINKFSIPITLKEALEEGKRISNARFGGENILIETTYNNGEKEIVSPGIEWFLCGKSPLYFINNYCFISVPNIGIIPFKSYYFQQEVLKNIHRYNKVIYLKSRQCGVSVMSSLYTLWRCLFRSSETIDVVSINQKKSQDFVSKMKTSLELLPEFLKLKIVEENKSRITFENKSQITSEPASENAGRSDTLSCLIMDELAFYRGEDLAEKIVASATPALTKTGGQLIQISCYTKDTYIYTQNGLEQIKDYIPINCNLGYNDIEEFKIDGLNHGQKTETIYYSGITENKKITLKNKNTLEVSNIHPLWIVDTDNPYGAWKQAKDIKIGDFVVYSTKEKTFGNNDYIGFDWIKKSIRENNIKLHINNFDGYITEDLAYFFGLLIGDGYFNSKGQYAIITNQDYEIQDWLLTNKHFLFYRENRKDDNIHFRTHGLRLIQLLEFLGFEKTPARNKTIPKRLLSMSKENIAALLRGLFDSDGFSRTRDGTVGFASTSRELIKQVEMLLGMFGIVSTQSREIFVKPTEKVKSSSYSYNIYLSGYFSKIYYEKIGFKIKRKNKFNILSQKDLYINYKFVDKKVKNIIENIDYGVRNSFGKNERKGWKCPSKYIGEYGFIRRDSILKIIEYYKGIYESEDLKELEDFYNKEFYYMPILSIEESENETYDFVIPETRSLYANGIIGSNTPNGMSKNGKYYYEQIQEAKLNNEKNTLYIEVDWFEIPDTEGIVPAKGYNKVLEKYIKLDYFNNPEARREMRNFFAPIFSNWRDNEWLNFQHRTLGSAKFEQEIGHNFVIMENAVISKDYQEKIKLCLKDPLIMDRLGSQEINGLWIWKLPQPSKRYIAGVDISKGSGKDTSSMEIIDVDTYEQVAEYKGFISTAEYSKVIKKIARFYNEAYVVIESNGIGEAVFNGVYSDSIEPYYNVFKQKKTRNNIEVMTGWNTDVKTRQLITNNFIDWIVVDELFEKIKIYSSRLYEEITTWVMRDGRPDHAVSGHDDSIMAFSLALYNRNRAERTGDSFLVDENGKLVELGRNEQIKSIEEKGFGIITSDSDESDIIEKKYGMDRDTYTWLIG